MGSKFNKWPSKADPKIYKFNSFWFELRQYSRGIDRETYSLLDWMGDIGGLMDALFIITVNMIKPIAAIVLNSELLSQAFKLVKDKGEEKAERSKIK